ncbi:hypothetical protein [Pectobacterium versatile]|uniref:hypothetical protein n=1 Tax=Pectobacterium versatile TaxID=2488639 RepID=UPI001F441303|nr:hypothetical protein [Pectobacterium versatile]
MSLQQVWVKTNLPAGDLQLLTTCHPSGVLRLTQSGYGIDQTTYFRNDVFGDLAWNLIANKEMANANFRLKVNGVDVGVHNLEISHKASWESNQDNYTTGLHWGNATNLVQDDSLIGKNLILYKATGEGYDYLIEIN